MSTEAQAIKLSLRNTAEQNRKVIESKLWKNKEFTALRESVKRRMNLDVMDSEKFPIHEGRFDWNKAHERLVEADSASSFSQLLRAGVNVTVNQMYQSVETSYEDWVHVVATDKFEELFAPLHGVTFPREIGRQQKYAELRAAGLDIKLRVRKYGSMYPVEFELAEMDQTGQVVKMSGLMGEYLRLVAEVLVMGKLASVSGTKYMDLEIPTSETKPSDEANYPWTLDSAPFIGGGYNKLSPGVMNQANIQKADIALMNQRNLLGIKMQAKGNRLLVGPYWKFDAATLLNSSFFPTAQATGTGTFQSINPIKGLYNLTVSRFMFDHNGSADANSKAWYMLDDSKPFAVLLMKEAVKLEQEAVNAGESFDRDIIRFKGRTMLNFDFIDPRFIIQGNNGSV